MNAKNIVVAILVLALIGGIGYFIMNQEHVDPVPHEDGEVPNSDEMIPVEPDNGIGDGAESLPELLEAAKRGDKTIIGSSVAKNEITAYHFGEGATELLFIGGTHGGYSWNTALVSYELIDYLEANPDVIPDNITVTVIPVLNPDGLESTVGTTGKFAASTAQAVSETTRIAGRFNSNKVDLNRNFACDWSEEAIWRSQKVSGGEAAFSEPEAAALKDYINTHKPAAAVVWFSSEGKVYPSACGSAPSKQSVELAATFATAAGYGAAAEFDAYAITGDMVNWMAKQDIPAISVLLTDHKNTEWSKNQAGFEAVLKAYAN